MSALAEFKYVVRTFANKHRQGRMKNIFLFATARGGSTWLMEILASQPGIKYYDEPFNIRRANVARAGAFTTWASVMPDTGDPDRIVDYLNDIASGRYAFMNPAPFRPHYRFFTDRIVFKIHELEHMMGTVAERCNGQIVYLLRHPIPTSQSRYQFPRLELFLSSDYYRRLVGDARTWQEIQRLGSSGSHLQRGIVSWCFENLIPLKHRNFEGLFVAYEELVLNSSRAARLLADELRFTDPGAMLRAFNQPSTNISMSSAETRSMMQASDEQRRQGYLVSKWRAKISPADEHDVEAILKLFGIDDYRADAVLPHRRWLHFSDTPDLLALSTASPAPAAAS